MNHFQPQIKTDSPSSFNQSVQFRARPENGRTGAKPGSKSDPIANRFMSMMETETFQLHTVNEEDGNLLQPTIQMQVEQTYEQLHMQHTGQKKNKTPQNHIQTSQVNPSIQRAMINDTSGNPIAYEFRTGTELEAPFITRARTLTRNGALSDVGLRILRAQALRLRGTLDDHERMFMAGLLDVANVAVFNHTAAGSSFRFPTASITNARLNHVNNLDRSLPSGVQTETRELADSLVRGDIVGAIREASELETASVQGIRQLAGSFRNQANLLLGFISTNNILASVTIRAMVNAASDNSSGDRVLAGVVYAIAEQASHPFTSNITQGNIKIDALVPSAIAAIPGFTGGEEAAYVTAGQASGTKGDTMYVKTNLNPNNVYHRSVVIHELRHAQEDASSSVSGRPTFPVRNQMEARAYRSQARYIYSQMANFNATQKQTGAAQIAQGLNSIVVVALVLEGKTNQTQNQAQFILINNQLPASQRLSALQISNAFALSTATLQTRLLQLINSLYGFNNSNLSVTDGLAGESMMNWISRI